MRVRLAKPADVPVVARVLSAAAAKLRERGEELWTEAEVSEQAVAPHARGGLYYLGCESGEAVGVFRLQVSHPAFWPEVPEGTSAYLHKLAVVSGRQGTGLAHEMLRHAAGLARQKGFRFLRLDCRSERPKLSAIYESFGFRHHSQKQLGGHLFKCFELNLLAPDA